LKHAIDLGHASILGTGGTSSPAYLSILLVWKNLLIY
jgi:hypothetical protein